MIGSLMMGLLVRGAQRAYPLRSPLMRTPFASEHDALRNSVQRLVDGPLVALAEAAERGDPVHAEVLRRCEELGLFELDDVLAEVAACEALGRLRSGGLVTLVLDAMLLAELGVADGAGAVVRDAPGLVSDEGGCSGVLAFVVGGVLARRCLLLDRGLLLDCEQGWQAQAVVAPHALRGGAVASVTLDGVPAEPFEVPAAAVHRSELREAAAAVGAAHAAFDAAAAYAQQREAFGRPIARFQVNRHALAEMATHITAAEALVLDTAWQWASGDAADPAAARLYAARTAVAAADRALQLHGGYGYTTAFDAQRAWRDARALLPTLPALRMRLVDNQGTAR
jgi:alkylation response protein AidB-like acyl-CoA dehydrogenase